MEERHRRLVAAVSSLCLVSLACGPAPTPPEGGEAPPGPTLRSQGTETVSFDEAEGLATGESVEGLGTVHEFLDIRSLADPSGDVDGGGTRTVLVTEGSAPGAYLAGTRTANGCLADPGGAPDASSGAHGFSDVEATRTSPVVPHRYRFTFGPGGMARSFSLAVLDHGDFATGGAGPVEARLTAFDRDGHVVDRDRHRLDSTAPSMDACRSDGLRRLEVSGSGIVRVVLEQADGVFDGGVAFDDIRFELAAADVGVEVHPEEPEGCVNNDGHGVIPVAVLSSRRFDATSADPATLRLDGLEVAVRGNGRNRLVSRDDVDGDGRDDLVAKFDDEAGTWEGREAEATLTGEMDDGTPFRGSDLVCLVP